MKHKTFEVELKAEGDAGEVVALASVFNNVDLVGDRIKPGAFTKTLKKWADSGNPIPIVSSHQWDDPMAHIGVADPNQVKQTSQGLVVKGHLDMDNPLAAQVHRLMKRRSLTGWSFGYTVPQDGEFMDDKGINNITEIELHEVGPTLVGANPEAQLQAVKSALTEPVVVNGNDGAAVQRAIDVAIETAIDDVEQPEPAQVSSVEDGSDEEPSEAKSAPQDPLKKRSMELVLEISNEGVPRYEPEVKAPEPEPPSVAELRRRTFEAYLAIARDT